MYQQKNEKNTGGFLCENCNFFTSRNSLYKRHLLTAKHKNQQKSTDFQQISSEKIEKNTENTQKYACECGKNYKERTGLWRHKKICKYNAFICEENEEVPKSEPIIEKDLIMMLIKQNSDLMELLKTGTNNNNVNHAHSHNNNKTFNLQFFLNETCKDAMNITDFVESIKVQLSDIERMGEVGYVEGISNIITTNLKALDVTERPVHCTDKKRETIYIKDENRWEKEDDKKTKMRKAINKIASKNYKLLPEYRKKYPGCQFADNKFSNNYNKMMIEVMGGVGNDDLEKEDRIIRNISKNVLIEK